MKNIKLVLCLLLLLIWAKNTHAQSDFDIRLTETEIDNTFETLIAARGLNFGEYITGGTGLSSWIGDVKAAHINILPNNQIEIHIDDMRFEADINVVTFDFQIVADISGVLNGEIVVEENEINGINAVIHISSIDNLNSWGDLGNLIGQYASLFGDGSILEFIPDIPLSLTKLTPDLVTEYFDFGTPLVTTDNESIYLNFILKGDRFITIENQLNKIDGLPRYDLGEIGHLEGVNFENYQSGFEFAWDQNSIHTFRSDYDGEDLNNYHYKYLYWKDQEIDFVRTHSITQDKKFTALLENSYEVNFGMTIDGFTGALGNFSIATIDFNYPSNEYVVAAPLSEPVTANNFSNNGKNFYFLNWNDGTTTPSNNFSGTQSSQSKIANYKGAQYSNNSNAYKSSSQRKFVYNQGNYCRVSVYESLGKIWLEGSYDDGETWEILNNGKPLSGSGTASDPSLVSSGSSVLVVFQENNDIRVIIYSLNRPDADPIKENKIVHTLYTANAKPVIEKQNNYNNNTELYLIVWKEDYVNPFSSPGLYYRCLEKSGSGYTYNFINNRTKISNTDANSTNPTLAAKYNHDYLHIAWEQQLNTYESEIRYYKINRSSTNTLSFSHYYKPSLGNVFLINSYPTMTVVETGGMYLVWVGSSHESEDPPFKQVIMRCRHTANYWYSTFYKYGSAVNNVSINSAEVSNQYYYGLAWVENGSTNYYKAPTISGIQTLNTNGNYVQLANGLGSVNNMQAMTFKNTIVPYAFTVSEKFGTGLSKTNSSQDIEGREGLVSYPTKDNAETEIYYFTISDIKVDGKPIKFVELHDTVMVKNIDDLNKYLTTESFELSSLSELTYNASFGLADGEKETKQITNGKKVKFRVELVGAEDKKVLGIYEQVDFKSGTNESKNKNTYKITPKLKKNNKVSLRLVVEDDDKGQYLISSILSKSSVLGKAGAVEIVNSGNLIVEEYQLTQNYPNPFNPQTTINYQLPKDGLVTLKVYDALGKEVAELVNGYKSSGSYNVTFDGSNLASGIYFYKITSGEFTSTKKLMLMK